MLQDNFKRQFKYIRLSITKKCNFRCTYCLPNGYNKTDINNELSKEEIFNLAVALGEHGIEKIRLTGGEPTLREDFLEIATSLASISNIKTLALTTNGFNLKKKAKQYYNAGISNINISIDSLNPVSFQKITQTNFLQSKLLPSILEGVEECLTLPFKKVKINVVLLKNYNFNDLQLYLDLVKHHAIDIRFIALMPTQDNQDFYDKEYISTQQLLEILTTNHWQHDIKNSIDGPANNFSHKDYKGRIGVINPYHNSFCDGCNRLRIDSHGYLILCLLNFGMYNLRSFLDDASKKEDLKNYIQSILLQKPEKNLLNIDKTIIANTTFSKIGG